MIRPIVIALAVVSILMPPAWAGEADKRPNVLLIMVDDLRTGLSSFYPQGLQTPTLDALAEEGVSFGDTYANVPVCGASRASFLTGMRPTSGRFLTYYTRVDEDVPDAVTLPQAFKQHGYATHGIGKVFHHVGDSQQSWTLPAWNPVWHGASAQGWRDYLVEENLAAERAGKPPFSEKSDTGDSDYFDGQHADRAIAYLHSRESGAQPFFLAVGFVKPHLPFNAPAAYWDRYDPAKIELSDVAPAQNAPQQAWHNFGELRAYDGIVPSPEVVDQKTARALVHGYLASMSYVDAQIGRLLAALAELGLEDNTIILLMSDHGYALGEHELWVKHSPFNVAVEVPLVVKAPGIAGGTTRAGLTELVDVYPTLIELAGIDAPEGQLQGESLVPRLLDESIPGKGAVFPRWQKSDSIKTDKYLYTEWIGDGGAVTARMLFDHAEDPQERVNVADTVEYAGVVTDLSLKLQAHRTKDWSLKPAAATGADQRDH